jgi:hypothetical protein
MVPDLAQVGLDAPPKLALPFGPGGSSMPGRSGGKGSFLNLCHLSIFALTYFWFSNLMVYFCRRELL